MGKHFEMRKQHTIYVRKKYVNIWKEFIELIKSDKKFNQMQYKDDAGIVSVAIMNLIYEYTQNRKEELKSKNGN